MKVQATTEHINLLQDIARQAVEIQNRSEVDTGPGGDDADGVARELRKVNDMLSYWLGEDED